MNLLEMAILFQNTFIKLDSAITNDFPKLQFLRPIAGAMTFNHTAEKNSS
jgi:hypothetical protein